MPSQQLPDIEKLKLPALGQTYTPGLQVESFTFTVTAKTTKANLHEKLKNYGQPTSGNRTEMLDRLRNFSNDQDEWLSLFKPKLKRKRGEHTSRQSLSKRRIDETFGVEEQTIAYKSKKSASRVQRALQDGDRAANSAWAHAVLSTFRTPTSLTRQRRGLLLASQVQAAAAPATSTDQDHRLQPEPQPSAPLPQGYASVDNALAVRMRKVEHNTSSIQGDLSNVENNISVLTSHILDMKTLMRSKGACPESALGPCHDDNTTIQFQGRATDWFSHNAQPQPCTTAGHVAATTSAAALLPAAPREPLPSKKLGIAHLGSERFSYDKTTVPSPPTIHLSQDISRLCREWEASNLLVVNGRGIPVKYWGEFYKRGKGVKTSAWDALRVEWGNWKFIAEERQRYSSEDLFWNAFSDESGNKFSYQQILDRLAERRTSAAVQDANDARAFFGGNLDHPLANGAFRYTKSGKSCLSSKDDVITRKWRELLASRSDIAEQWASFDVTTGSSSNNV